MSPICSESYLFFFLAFLKLVAYFSSNFSHFVRHVRITTGSGLAQIFCFPSALDILVDPE